MPASTLQSRISAFESLSSPLQQPIQPRVIPSTPPRASPSPSPPNLGRKSSLIDLKIDLRDWVLDDGSNDSLIHFSPPKSPGLTKPPPLPPRKQDSLTVHTYPPALDSPRGHTHASSVSSFHSVSLSPSTPEFPQSPSSTTATPTAAHHTTGSSASTTSSFEELSASAALVSPASSALISHDWEKAMARRVPPKLPARPAAVSPPPQAQGRRTAPPPPPSIRSVSSASSIRSQSANSVKSQSANSLKSQGGTGTARAPPIPPAARRRYDALFTTLVSAHAPVNQKPALLGAPKRRAAGWRGLSVDLIRDPNSGGGGGDYDEKEKEKEKGGGEGEVLPGPVVRVLWARSRLPVGVLSAIWTDLDPHHTGALDREAFARGMWRVDEELRRAQLLRNSHNSTSLAARNRYSAATTRPPPTSGYKGGHNGGGGPGVTRTMSNSSTSSFGSVRSTRSAASAYPPPPARAVGMGAGASVYPPPPPSVGVGARAMPGMVGGGIGGGGGRVGVR